MTIIALERVSTAVATEPTDKSTWRTDTRVNITGRPGSAVGVASLMPNPCFTRAASVSPSPTFEAARPEQQLHQDQKQQMQQQQGPQAGAGGEADSLLSSPSPALSRMTQDTSSPPPPLNFNGSSSPSKIGSSVSSSPNQSQICASQVNPPSVLPLAPYQRQQVQQQAYPPNGNVAPPLQPAGASSRLEWQSDQNAWLQPNQQPMNSPRLQGQSQGQPMVQPQVYQPYNPAYAVSQTRPSPQHPQPAQYVQLYYYQAPGTGQGPPSTPGTAAQGHLTPETSSRLKGWRNRLSSQWAPNIKADKDKPAEPQPALSNHSKNRLSSDKFLSALKRPSKQADESAGSAATPAPQQPAQQHQPAHHHPHWMMPGHRPQQASLPQAHQMPPPQHGMASGQYHQPQPQPQPQPQQQLYGALGGHVPVQGSYLPQWQATPAPVCAPAPEGSNSMVSSSLQKEQQDEMSRATTAKDTQSPSMSSPSISSRQGETSNPGLVSPKTDDGDNVSPTKKDNGDPDDTNVPEKGKDKARVLSVDVTAKTPDHDDLYDATPRLPQGAADTGKARNDAAMSSSDSDSDGDDDMARSATAAGILTASSVASQMEQKPKPEYSKPESSTGQYELEDTAGARMRTMRLSSQEEKIYYDPDADKPKMSATSYPGQEWNPYSDAEFTYWDD
ncbi:hypothetical protein GMORB2_3590 [Geosmithia morbida]|uniref:Uncharacterized protein n=1 Tax=Geosmithia morbida TaxID=1094350 RepID=A0A9P4YQE3_9HYPO|nr:uncharacterized protein GMORB2_3590 [Geosmithia morbida]KAF4119902.1 hypothetical protein GMORB2_3590 [Geosmithia morbida]